jgi:mRNA interferase MazF
VAGILRGEIYWADLHPLPGPVRGREQAGLRPVLVLSQDIFNRRSETVIAMAITSQPQNARFPLTFDLPEGTLTKPSWVKISQVRTISVDRLGKRIGSVSLEDLNQIVNGLIELIG